MNVVWLHGGRNVEAVIVIHNTFRSIWSWRVQRLVLLVNFWQLGKVVFLLELVVVFFDQPLSSLVTDGPINIALSIGSDLVNIVLVHFHAAHLLDV